MLYPPVADLLKNVDSRYLLVNVVAHRARQIAMEAEAFQEELPEKPVTLAIQEVADGKLSATVKDEYKNMDTLTIPKGYDTFMVTEIGKSFLSGTTVKRVIITADTNVATIMNGAFLGASSLKALEIQVMVAGSIIPPDSFDGAHPELVVYIPSGSDYKTHYGWGDMGLTFENIKED